ncbi:hypothetical protein E0L36_24960 [Streptomyces sp. AJS327]|uniref:hypothetical protein n=1 Tax=Streptomyces sp. AJS327 TaxID=2545265 RepID=UPI0015DD6CF5|nr:hypothetical protein [Streptomyces sp. AJS327]MBA0053982.1 hypothetical protein [Streptomyces sp. AJS327]
MSILMRSPRECAAWVWELEESGATVGSALAAASRVVGVLADHRLLEAREVECDWFEPGTGGLAIRTTLGLALPLGDPSFVSRVVGSRPVGFPLAEVGDVRIIGSGVWIDGGGAERREPRLLDLELSPDPTGLGVELSVHHDIWQSHDFSGVPHPDLWQRNAPRLADAVRAVEAELGGRATPGEPTRFGVAEGYGVAAPDLEPDGSGPNLLDLM